MNEEEYKEYSPILEVIRKIYNNFDIDDDLEIEITYDFYNRIMADESRYFGSHIVFDENYRPKTIAGYPFKLNNKLDKPFVIKERSNK